MAGWLIVGEIRAKRSRVGFGFGFRIQTSGVSGDCVVSDGVGGQGQLGSVNSSLILMR